MNNKQTLIALFSSVALLSGCGGGSDAPPPAAADAVPDSASASAKGLMSYLSDLATMLVDNKEPLDLSGFAPKTSEDSEPEPVS